MTLLGVFAELQTLKVTAAIVTGIHDIQGPFSRSLP